MSQITIGPFTYKVLKQEGNRLLLSWIETTGIEKTRWIVVKGL